MKQDQSSPLRFWLGRVLFTGAAGFFLVFGISLLVGAYRLRTPAEFIMTFFAANLIILISAALGAGFIVSMYRRLRGGGGGEEESPGQSD